MSCDTLLEALIDVARGRDVDAGTVAAVEDHIEQCASCRARYTRELALSDGLRALARANQSASASAGIEAKLLVAFTTFAPEGSRRSLGEGGRPANRELWMRMAAAVVLMAAAGATWWVIAGSRVGDVRTPPTVAIKPQETTPPPSEARETAPPVTTRAHVQTTATPPRRQRTSSGRDTAARVIRPDGFVALPSAEGLPAFESGEIVRVEVPVTSLPMYGIDIAPDASASAVEADFLVGQDGQARAIRLVRSGRL